jgi:hypothetical protein
MRSCVTILVLSLAPSTFMACSSSGQSSGMDGGGSEQQADGGNGVQGDGAGAVSGDGPSVADSALPPIDPATEITDLLDAQVALTNTQTAELCDWWMSELGGYGAVIQCAATGGGARSFQNPANQATCLSTFSAQFHCTVTVGDFETCVRAQAPSKGCDLPSPQCSAVLCSR